MIKSIWTILFFFVFVEACEQEAPARRSAACTGPQCADSSDDDSSDASSDFDYEGYEEEDSEFEDEDLDEDLDRTSAKTSTKSRTSKTSKTSTKTGKVSDSDARASRTSTKKKVPAKIDSDVETIEDEELDDDATASAGNGAAKPAVSPKPGASASVCSQIKTLGLEAGYNKAISYICNGTKFSSAVAAALKKPYAGNGQVADVPITVLESKNLGGQETRFTALFSGVVHAPIEEFPDEYGEGKASPVAFKDGAVDFKLNQVSSTPTELPYKSDAYVTSNKIISAQNVTALGGIIRVNQESNVLSSRFTVEANGEMAHVLALTLAPDNEGESKTMNNIVVAVPQGNKTIFVEFMDGITGNRGQHDLLIPTLTKANQYLFQAVTAP